MYVPLALDLKEVELNSPPLRFLFRENSMDREGAATL
jgi:hypothetical protein